MQVHSEPRYKGGIPLPYSHENDDGHTFEHYDNKDLHIAPHPKLYKHKLEEDESCWVLVFKNETHERCPPPHHPSTGCPSRLLCYASWKMDEEAQDESRSMRERTILNLLRQDSHPVCTAVH